MCSVAAGVKRPSPPVALVVIIKRLISIEMFIAGDETRECSSTRDYLLDEATSQQHKAYRRVSIDSRYTPCTLTTRISTEKSGTSTPCGVKKIRTCTKRGKNLKRLFDCDGKFFVFLLSVLFDSLCVWSRPSACWIFTEPICRERYVGHWINELFLFINSIYPNRLRRLH